MEHLKNIKPDISKRLALAVFLFGVISMIIPFSAAAQSPTDTPPTETPTPPRTATVIPHYEIRQFIDPTAVKFLVLFRGGSILSFYRTQTFYNQSQQACYVEPKAEGLAIRSQTVSEKPTDMPACE